MRTCLLSVYVLAQLATPCLAQSVDSAELPPAERREVPANVPAAAIEQLVVGDDYVIEVEQSGVKQRFEGTLAQATDEWVALRRVEEGRNEFGVPVVSKLPWAGRLFRNVGIGRESGYLWLPRAATTIKGRTLADQSANRSPISMNTPKLRCQCEIEYAKDGSVKSSYGPLTALNDRELTVTLTLSENAKKPMPVLGKIPLVGQAFTTQSVEITQHSISIAMKDVFCIHISDHEMLNDALSEE